MTRDRVPGHNLYAYCDNNPNNYVDPNGEFAWWVASALISTVSAILDYWWTHPDFKTWDVWELSMSIGRSIVIGLALGAIGKFIVPAIGESLAE